MDVWQQVERLAGWFHLDDRLLFEWVLRDQAERGISGDIFEIGCYLGKSAVLLGNHLREDETLTVVDVFEGNGDTSENVAESERWYSGVTRATFEQNYLAVHPQLPAILQMSSLAVTDEVADGSARFTHIDGCHLYDFARSDLALASRVTRDRGIIIFDDYRSKHTYGAAAAIWEAIISDSLTPLFLSNWKLYASWSPDEGIVDRLVASVEGCLSIDTQRVRGFALPRLWVPLPSLSRRDRAVRNLLPLGIVKLRERRSHAKRMTALMQTTSPPQGSEARRSRME